jgi:hypothetical protein
MLKTECVNCGSNSILPVEYGTPHDEMISRIEKGEILHGGCAIQGLMQAHYCKECDTRFDVQCTDEFINHIKALTYSTKDMLITIYFEIDHLTLHAKYVEKEIPYLPELKEALKQTALEFWKEDNGNVWQIDIDCPGYFRDSIHLHGTEYRPSTFYKFNEFIQMLLSYK